jgi:hypothetical protein
LKSLKSGSVVVLSHAHVKAEVVVPLSEGSLQKLREPFRVHIQICLARIGRSGGRRGFVRRGFHVDVLGRSVSLKRGYVCGRIHLDVSLRRYIVGGRRRGGGIGDLLALGVGFLDRRVAALFPFFALLLRIGLGLYVCASVGCVLARLGPFRLLDLLGFGVVGRALRCLLSAVLGLVVVSLLAPLLLGLGIGVRAGTCFRRILSCVLDLLFGLRPGPRLGLGVRVRVRGRIQLLLVLAFEFGCFGFLVVLVVHLQLFCCRRSGR